MGALYSSLFIKSGQKREWTESIGSLSVDLNGREPTSTLQPVKPLSLFLKNTAPQLLESIKTYTGCADVIRTVCIF